MKNRRYVNVVVEVAEPLKVSIWEHVKARQKEREILIFDPPKPKTEEEHEPRTQRKKKRAAS